MAPSVALAGDSLRMIWPTKAAQAGTYAVTSAGIIVNSAILGLRYPQLRVFWNVRIRESAWRANALLMLTFLISFSFTWIAGFLQFGVGLASSPSICHSGIIVCVAAYGGTKITTYLFLLERLYIVSRTKIHKNSRAWLCGVVIFVLGLPLVGAFIAAESYNYVATSGHCHIGLRRWGSFSIIAWDAVLNSYLSFCFVYQLKTAALQASPLRKLAFQTAWMTAVGLITSFVNIIVLGIIQSEYGYVCLSCCTLDVLLDAFTLSVLTPNTATQDRAQSMHAEMKRASATHASMVAHHISLRTNVESDSAKLDEIESATYCQPPGTQP